MVQGLLGNAAAYQQRAGLLGGGVAGPASYQAQGGGGFAAPGGAGISRSSNIGQGLAGIGEGIGAIGDMMKARKAEEYRQKVGQALAREDYAGARDIAAQFGDTETVMGLSKMIEEGRTKEADALQNQNQASAVTNEIAPQVANIQSALPSMQKSNLRGGVPVYENTMTGDTLLQRDRANLETQMRDPEQRARVQKERLNRTRPQEATPRSGVLGEYDQAVADGFEGSFQDYYNWRANQKKPLVTVSNEPPALELEENKAEGKRLVAEATKVFDAAEAAKQQLDQLRLMANLPLDEEGIVGKAQVFLGSIGRGLGFTDEQLATFNLDGATDAQKFQAVAMEMVLSKLATQKGPQTDKDAQRIIESVATIGNTPEARQFIIRAATNIARDTRAKARFIQEHRADKNTYQGAFKAWDDMMYETPLTGVSDDGETVFYYEEMDRLKAENPNASIEQLNDYWRQAYGN